LTKKRVSARLFLFRATPNTMLFYSKGVGYLRQIPISLPIKGIGRQGRPADALHHGVVFSATYKGRISFLE
jgi:hypothetical protein